MSNTHSPGCLILTRVCPTPTLVCPTLAWLTASGDEGLADAGVDARDLLRVEGGRQVLEVAVLLLHDVRVREREREQLFTRGA